MYPLAKKEGNFVLMYPLFVFPYLRTLRAVFSETMRFYAGLIHLLILIDIPLRRVRGCDNHPKSLLMHPSVTSTPPLLSQASRLWPTASRKSVAGFFYRCSLQVCFKNGHFRSISRTTDFGHLIALPFGPKRPLLNDVPFGWFLLIYVPFRQVRA